MVESGHPGSVPEAAKRQQLSESLRGPAAEVICNLWMGKNDYVAMDYTEALYAVVRRVEKTSDLLYAFSHMHQQKGDRLSEYFSSR